ncbi:MAG: hypothetical protein AAGB12_16045 [Pseudomonadota bacterium]
MKELTLKEVKKVNGGVASAARLALISILSVPSLQGPDKYSGGWQG